MTEDEGVIQLADRMRRTGCADRRILARAAREESPDDGGATLVRHAAIHAGIVRPSGWLGRFRFCPECGERLDVPADIV